MAEALADTAAVWSAIPAASSPDALAAWLDASLASLGAATAADLDPSTAFSTEVADTRARGPFGRLGDPRWQRHVAAMLLADWACYPAPVDRVSLERLAFAAGVFPRGFRVWWARHAKYGFLPVGYTAWHPLSEAQFRVLEQRPEALIDRTVLPLPDIEPEKGFAHIFNYSIVPPLQKTEASRRMLATLARDLAAVRPIGLSAITVSEDGARVARRFGMERSGLLRVAGAEEWVFTGRPFATEKVVAPLTDPSLSILNRLDHYVWILDIDEWKIVWANPPAIAFWKGDDLESFVRRPAVPTSDKVMALNFEIRERLKTERFVRVDHTFYLDGRPPERVAVTCSLYPLPDGRRALLTEMTPIRVTDPETLRRMDAVQYAPLVMTTHAIDGLTLAVNGLARSAFGDHFDFIGMFADPQIGRALLERLVRGEPVSEDVELRTLRGLRWYAIEARNMKDPVTGLPAVLMSAHEITARHEIERAKDELLSMVSHELRTPLTAIRGAIELLANGVLAGDATTSQEMLGIARENLMRLNRAVDDLLDVRRLGQGAVELSNAPADLSTLAREAVLLQEQAARAAGVSIELSCAEELVCNVDAPRIVQVISSLLSNAVKHSPTGQAVSMEVLRAGERGRVIVTDHGSGVPPSFRDRIFTVFAQADSSDSRRTGGTGLGLYIAKALVEKHGGELRYDLESGEGTQFYFDLPLLGR